MIDDKRIQLNKSQVHRRDFLKLLGLTAGGYALSKIPFSHESAVTSVRPDKILISQIPKIGLIIPDSGLYPELGKNIKTGLSLALKRSGISSAIVGEKIKTVVTGNRRHENLAAVRELIQKNKCEILVGVIPPITASEMHNELEENGKFLIVTNAGANVVRTEEQSPYIFYNTLGYWQSNFALGQWAARHLGRNIFIATSFYESGYDALYAFRTGAEQEGGKIIETHVSHLPNAQTEMHELMGRIKNAAPDFVFAAYSGNEAAEFLSAYSKAGLENKIPLAASSFMAETSMLNKYRTSFPSMISCSSWMPGLTAGEKSLSVKHTVNKSENPDDRFAVLGFDTGILIAETLHATGNKLTDISLVRESLRNAAFNSPRGKVFMNCDTQSITTPLYLYNLNADMNKFSYAEIDELKTVGSNNRVFTSLCSQQRTGWLNEYLVV